MEFAEAARLLLPALYVAENRGRQRPVLPWEV